MYTSRGTAECFQKEDFVGDLAEIHQSQQKSSAVLSNILLLMMIYYITDDEKQIFHLLIYYHHLSNLKGPIDCWLDLAAHLFKLFVGKRCMDCRKVSTFVRYINKTSAGYDKYIINAIYLVTLQITVQFPYKDCINILYVT